MRFRIEIRRNIAKPVALVDKMRRKGVRYSLSFDFVRFRGIARASLQLRNATIRVSSDVQCLHCDLILEYFEK